MAQMVQKYNPLFNIYNIAFVNSFTDHSKGEGTFVKCKKII